LWSWLPGPNLEKKKMQFGTVTDIYYAKNEDVILEVCKSMRCLITV